MRVEDGGMAGAKALGELTLNFLKLLARLNKRVLKSTDLSSDFSFEDIAPFDCVMSLVEDENFPFGHTSGHRDAPDNRLSCV
jgi:hypothetical protein